MNFALELTSVDTKIDSNRDNVDCLWYKNDTDMLTYSDSAVDTNDDIQDVVVVDGLLATFRLQYEDDYEYEYSVLSTRFRFDGRNFSNCACSEL